jgi:hypothetical protein
MYVHAEQLQWSNKTVVCPSADCTGQLVAFSFLSQPRSSANAAVVLAPSACLDAATTPMPMLIPPLWVLAVLCTGDQPRLLTTMQPVRKGTHGGVTLLGVTGAAAGGLLAGAVFYCAAVLSPTLWVFEAQVRAAAALCGMTEI